MAGKYPDNTSSTILRHIIREAPWYGSANGAVSLSGTLLEKNPLNPDQDETEQRSIDCIAYFARHIQQWMRENSKLLYNHHPRAAATGVARRLSTSFLQFMLLFYFRFSASKMRESQHICDGFY